MIEAGVGTAGCAAATSPESASEPATRSRRADRVRGGTIARHRTTGGIGVARTSSGVRVLFAAWVVFALVLLALGELAGQPANASRRAIAAPTRLSGVEAPEVKPTATGRLRGGQSAARTSVFVPTGR